MSEPFDPGLSDERFPFPAYPNGWSRVALSEELATGEVQSLRFFGRDLVLFRTEAGHARVLDAFCPHLGAHLGHGGRVEGEGLRCPFHAWHWDGEGRCLDVPYAKRIPASARVRSWPVCERNGFIFVYHHAEGRSPTDEVPAIPEHADPEWTPYTRLRWKIRSRLYDMGENAVDDVHFRYLHGAASLPKTKQGEVRGNRSNLSKLKLDTPAGPVDGSIESTSVPGMTLVYVRGICDTLIVITNTPIDGDYVDQMFCYTQKLGADEGQRRLAKALLRDLEKQINEDIVLFEHKAHWSRPLLVPEDGPIADYRRRAKGQYSGGFEVRDDARVVRPPLRQAKVPAGFQPRDFEELASFLRSTFRARRVERLDDAGTVELRLFGREETPKARLRFERASLDRLEVCDVRGHLAMPRVRRRIAAANGELVEIGSADLG